MTTAAKHEIASTPSGVLRQTRVRGYAPKNAAGIGLEAPASSTLRWGSWQIYDGTPVGSLVGLDYFGARYMSAAQGRFTSPDRPLADQKSEDPQSWNLYAYARNNPVNVVDLDGEAASKVLKLLYKGAKAAYNGQSFLSGLSEDIDTVSSAFQPDATPDDAVRGAKAVAGYVPLLGEAIDVYDGAISFFGGKYGDAPEKSGKETHHMPSKKANPGRHEDEGPAIDMDPADHHKTQTYGGGRGSKAAEKRAEQAKQIAAGKGRKVMADDIRDVRRVARNANHGRKYNKAMLDMLRYAKKLPELEKKKEQQ